MPRDRLTNRYGWALRFDRPFLDSSTPSHARPRSTDRSGFRWFGNGSCDLLRWPMVHRMLARGPQMLNGIGPPRTPTRAVLQQSPFIRGQAQLLGGHPKAQVAGGKSIR